MAFEFNAILNFRSEAAQQSMKDAKASFQQFKDGVGKANAGIGAMTGGVQAGALALAPLTAGMGFAIKEAATFEKGLDAVQATLLATDEQMRPLSILTKQLGAATKFSAFEATEGAKFLAQAGFDVNQIMTALPAVLSAAAAGEMELGVTADIVASTLGAFGLAADKAAGVADTLALGASLTNTDMLGLGEGLKYAAAQAAGAKMSVEDTVSVLGVLANAGLKGSMGGTALANALAKLADPSKETLALFGGKDGLNAAIKDSTGQLLPFEVMMANVMKVTQNAADPLTAMGQAAEIFGLRGGKAFNAFAMQATASTEVTDVMMKRFRLAGVDVDKLGITVGSQISTLEALRFQMNGAAGSAKQMADIQMGNFLGQLEQLSGAADGLGIEIGALALDNLASSTAGVTDAVSLLVAGFQSMNMTEAENAQMQTDMNDKNSLLFNRFAEFLPMTKEFAAGFKEGFAGVIEGLKSGFVAVKEFFAGFSDSGMTAKDIGKLVAQIVLVGAMLAPVLAGVAAFAFVMGPVITAVGGFFTFLAGVWGMVSGAFGLISAAVEILGVVFGVSTFAIWGVAAAVIGIIALIVVFREEIYEFGVTAFNAIIKFFRDPFATSFTEIGSQFGLFGKVAGTVLDIVTFGFKATIAVVGAFAGFLYDNVVVPIMNHSEQIKAVFFGVVSFVTGLFVNQFLPIITGVFTAVGGIVAALAETFVNVGQGILGFMSVVAGGIVDYFAFGFERIATFFTDVVFGSQTIGAFLSETLTKMGAGITSFFGSAFQSVLVIVAAGVDGFVNVLTSVGHVMFEVFMSPFRAILGFISEVISKVMEFVPASLLDKIGLSQSDMQALITVTTAKNTALPAPEQFASASEAVKSSAAIAKSTVDQTVLAQPPSADEMSSAFSSSISQNQSKESKQKLDLNVFVKGDVAGDKLNLVMTRAQVNQSQQNGNYIPDGQKRRAMSNGKQFAE